MPRDASGNYTLPAGNPVVVGTTIDASWANSTMDDIAVVLTDSLSRSGDGGMLVAFQNASGVVGAPGITWSSEPTSGFYLAATNDMRASIAGSDRARFRADASNPFQIWNGAAWTNVLSAGADATITADWIFSGLLTIPEASVTAHEAALTILETQISDGALLARFADQLTVFNNTDDAIGDVQIGTTSAISKSQSLSLVNSVRDIAFLNASTVFGWYDYTEAGWAVRCIPSTEVVQLYGQNAMTTADFYEAWKTSDTTVSGTLSTLDPHLQVAVPSSGRYVFEALLRFLPADATQGFRFVVGMTGGGTITNSYGPYIIHDSGGSTPSSGWIDVYDFVGDEINTVGIDAALHIVHLRACVETTDAGTVDIRWAKGSNTGGDLTLEENSSLVMRKMN